MNIPGKGWVRRVTIATLNDFRSLLRTGTEQAAETQVDEEVKSDGAGATDASALFGGISIEVPSQYRSHPQGPNVPPTGPLTSPSPATQQPSASPASPAKILPAVAGRRWYKQMSAADAQRPRAQNTNPTGHLTLVGSGHPIQHATWFHQDLFAGEDWIPSPARQRESARITFHIRIAGVDLGEIALDVTYTPRFEASQGNRTTVVHWGTTIGNLFREHDYTDYFVTIERTTSGTFLMVIDSSATGPFAG